jgi:hypothetical protein
MRGRKPRLPQIARNESEEGGEIWYQGMASFLEDTGRSYRGHPDYTCLSPSPCPRSRPSLSRVGTGVCGLAIMGDVHLSLCPGT